MSKHPGLTDEFHLALLAEIGLGRAAMMHEMRQPMAAIKLTLRLALDRAEDPELSGYLRDAITQVDRLATLLDQNQRFMQPQHSAIEEFALEPIVQRVLRMLEHSLRRRNVELVVELDDLPQVKASVASVEQILFNLVNNARDSIVEQGEPGRLLIRGALRDGAVEVVVADDGVGIPESFRANIFTPYSTTKGGKGTGMGLYVARKLAAAFGGALSLLDHAATEALGQPPLATAMKLQIPAAPAETDQAPLRREPSTAFWSASAVLEDTWSRAPQICLLAAERGIQRAVERTCESIGAEVETPDVLLPLDIGDVDLVLLEVDEASAETKLPALTGRVSAPPVIAMLPGWTTELAQRCVELGCREAVPAPAGSSTSLELQAVMLAALEEQRAYRAAMTLVRGSAPEEGSALDEGGIEQLARALAEEGELQLEVAVWGSQELVALASQVFDSCGGLPPTEPLPPSVDLLLVEPSEDLALSRLLGSLRTDELASVVICAERLSAGELQHLLDRGVHRTLTSVRSAPELTRARLAALASRLRARSRLATALKLLMREPLELMKTATIITRRTRVMIVEDEPVMLRVLSSVLRPHGYQLFACSSGEEALKIFADEEVDLIISDKNLPGINGLEVIRAGKERYSEVASLLITGYATQDSAELALQLQVDDYLVKPFNLDLLMSKVKQLLARPNHEAQMGRAHARPRGVVLAVPDRTTQELLERTFDRLDEPVVGKGPAAQVLNLVDDREVGIVVIDLDQTLKDAHRELLQRAWSTRSPLIVLALATRPGLTRTLEALRLGARVLLRKPLSDLAVVDRAIRDTCMTEDSR